MNKYLILIQYLPSRLTPLVITLAMPLLSLLSRHQCDYINDYIYTLCNVLAPPLLIFVFEVSLILLINLNNINEY